MLLLPVVMPGLVPGIHVLAAKDVAGRDKPGHDEKGSQMSVFEAMSDQ
jgi:hypothetical protein